VHAHGTTVADAARRRQDGDHGIGVARRKVDGADKATGRTKFVDDLPFSGLHASLARSTKAHARIVAIDVDAARALPGVKAVITGADLPARYGVIPWTEDETALAKDVVRYIGEPVVAVAAVDEETAQAAVRLIRIDYAPLVPVLDTAQARDGGDDDQTKVNPAAKRGNVTKAVSLSFGDVDANLRACADDGVVVDDDFFFHGTTHAAIEPHCAFASVDERGLLTLVTSTQTPHYVHRAVARVLGLPEHRVRVVQPPVGGGFGGKSEPLSLEFVVAKLALVTGQPVKLLYTREEVFYAHRGRHPMQMHFTVGADASGRLRAVRSSIDIDGGAYASFGLVTAYYAGQLLTGPVSFDSYAFSATRYYTNKPACGPKRGHGSVQPRFAFEVCVDRIARALGVDPIDLRRRNFAGEDVTLVNGQRLGSNGLLSCLEAVERASDWKNRFGRLPRGRGLGVACSMYISGTNYPIYPNDLPQSAVTVKLDRSGRVTVFSGASDIGQGVGSALAAIVCEELGVEDDAVAVVLSDSDLTPVDLGAYSSRGTLMVGHAALEACRALREQVQDATALHWGCAREDVLLGHGRAWRRDDTSTSLSSAAAFALAEARFGSLSSTGSYRTTPRGGDYRGGTIGASPAYSATAHVAEVTVDEETGRFDVVKVWVAHDCGRALQPTLVQGQIEGSTYMGLGEVVLEDMRYGDGVRAGMLVGPNLLDYRLPTSLDTPPIEALIVEHPDDNGPYGAKEAGEGPLHSSIPAVANAIHDAVGIRLNTLPFTPARVRAALRAQQAGPAPSHRGGA
jgi:4-hydroxybenzoyl-CoA reductase alpha subunit